MVHNYTLLIWVIFRSKTSQVLRNFHTVQKCKKFSVYELPHRQSFEGKNFHQLFLSRSLRGKPSQIINSTYSAYYITLILANTYIIIFNNYIAHFPVWYSLSKQSPLCGDTTFTRTYGLLQLELHDYTYSPNLEQFLL